MGNLNDLLVAVQCGELGYSRYWQMLLTNRDFCYLAFSKRVISRQGGAYAFSTANGLVEDALKIPGWKRLLILEHDHEFPVDIFRKHAAYKEPIVASPYVLRDIEEPLPVFYDWSNDRHNIVIPNAERLNHMFQNPGLYPFDIVPCGCTSWRRDVLEEWPENQPVFSAYANAGGHTVSHDVFHCRVAQDQGWTMYVDTSAAIKHYALVPIDYGYTVRWWNTVGAKRAIEAAEKEAATA